MYGPESSESTVIRCEFHLLNDSHPWKANIRVLITEAAMVRHGYSHLGNAIPLLHCLDKIWLEEEISMITTNGSLASVGRRAEKYEREIYISDAVWRDSNIH